MAGRRLANSLAKKLEELDRRFDAAGDFEAEQVLEQQVRLILEAKREGLPLAVISVADGWALYFEAKRTTRLATFEWLHGTDGYVSEFGKAVWVPLAAADKLLKRFGIHFISLVGRSDHAF